MRHLALFWMCSAAFFLCVIGICLIYLNLDSATGYVPKSAATVYTSVERQGIADITQHSNKSDGTESSFCEFCEVFNTRLKARNGFDCVNVKLTRPETQICIYDVKVDRYVSGGILRYGAYEMNELKLVQSWFRQDPELGLIDIGTNIGMYSLTMATMGHKVVSVEPGTRHLMRLHRSVELGNLHGRITILRNAVGDNRGIAKMVYGKPDNQGTSSVSMLNDNELDLAKNRTDSMLYINKDKHDTAEEYLKTIWLDDILPFCNFSKAVIKMDIEGHEHKAFAHCQQLFRKIKIPYVIMEWYRAVERTKPPQNTIRTGNCSNICWISLLLVVTTHTG